MCACACWNSGCKGSPLVIITLQLLKGVTISQGGVLPHIPEVLLYKRSQWGKLKSASASQSSSSSQSVVIPAAPRSPKKPAATPPKKPAAKKPPSKKSAASKRKSTPKKKSSKVCVIH